MVESSVPFGEGPSTLPPEQRSTTISTSCREWMKKPLVMYDTMIFAVKVWSHYLLISLDSAIRLGRPAICAAQPDQTAARIAGRAVITKAKLALTAASVTVA